MDTELLLYDAGQFDPGTWVFLDFGIAFMAIGLLLIRFRGKPRLTWFSNWPPSPFFAFFFFGFATLWTLAAGSAVVSGWLEVHNALKTRSYRIVSGPVEHFHPMPHEGHAEESFTVQGVSFHYSDFEITPGYRKTESYGGGVHKTSNLRIGYICKPSKSDCTDPLIVRLEVLSAPPASAKTAHGPVAGMHPVVEVDLRQLLSDVEIGPRCCDMAEGFYGDGRYARYGYALLRGTYTVQGNTACSHLSPDETRCKAFYVDAHNRYWFGLPDSPDVQPVDPRPMAHP